jgi:hypothetical protein
LMVKGEKISCHYWNDQTEREKRQRWVKHQLQHHQSVWIGLFPNNTAMWGCGKGGAEGVGKTKLPKYKTGRLSEIAPWRSGNSLIRQSTLHSHAPILLCVFPCKSGFWLVLFVWVARHEKESSATRAPLNFQFLSGNYLLASEMCSVKTMLWLIESATSDPPSESLWVKPSWFSENDWRALHLWRNLCHPSISFLPMTNRNPQKLFLSSWPVQWWHSCFLTINRQSFLCHSRL